MNEDVMAAREYIRQCNNDKSLTWTHGDWATKYIEAMQAIVRNDLAEHPADESEPITEAWLRSVGFCTCDDFGFEGVLVLPGGGVNTLQYDDDGVFALYLAADSLPLPHVKTSGDVCLLCRALGIPLNEPAKDQP